MKKIFLNFDFYGAGNIGDDLMLDGFLRGLSKKYALYCSIPRDHSHQKMRFPEIRFIKKDERYKAAGQCDLWVGVGDTPFQLRSGDWFLKKLLKDASQVEGRRKNYFFIGIGAEMDSIRRKDEFREAVSNVDFFWTRDTTTYDILIEEMKIQPDKVAVSSDLANISLDNIFPVKANTGKKKYDIGFCYYDENISASDINGIKKIILSCRGKKKKCLLFGNEIKNEGDFEYSLYKRMFNRLELVLNRNIRILKPDYYGSKDIEKMISHYNECEYVVTSRYHALLTAAWAGCKVICLERSSKVSTLASDLDIYEIKKPFSVAKFNVALKEARSVKRSRLENYYRRAMQSVEELEGLISKSKTRV